MNGQELFWKYTAERSFDGSQADVYAQTLMTIYSHVGSEIFPLLEKAERQGKMLDVRPLPPGEEYLQDLLTFDDIILI